MSRTDLASGRSEQKLRTRRALLEAARELIEAGEEPVIEAVAERARVSRATAYRYFASTDKLAFEAGLDAIFEATVLDPAALDPDDVVERISQVQAFLYDNARENETQYRLFLSNGHREWVETKGETDVRGGRRVPMIEAALAPVRAHLSEAAYRRLVQALVGMMGIDSLVMMRDINHLDHESAKATMNWAVRQLVRSALPAERRKGVKRKI